jgi:hypothetical protein
VEDLYATLEPKNLQAREIEKRAMLRMDKTARGESRWNLMAPAARTEEIKRMILLDLAKGLPIFDEWLATRESAHGSGGAS